MEIRKLNNRIIAVMIMLVMVFSLAVIDVQAAGSSKSVKLSKVNTPTTVNLGSPYVLRGKVKANEKIYKIFVGVVSKETGKWATRYTEVVNKKTFNIKKADPHVRFGKLPEGIYYYRISVRFKGQRKSERVLNKKFAVVNNKADTIEVSVPENSSLRLSGVSAPGTYPVGKEFVPRGTVTADKRINKVEVGIVYAPTNKWLEYKYTGYNFTKTFDLSKAASKLNFEKLPGGEYYYRMYVHTADGVKIAFNKSFTVIPSSRPAAAVSWAIDIANNDEFSYGKKPKTSKVGCYFCGTNQKRKPKGYEKTYVCLTFVEAAYAHGARDPEMLAECMEGKHTMFANEYNLTKYSCWQKIGLAKDLTVDDLQPGDVLVYYTPDGMNNGHVAMFAGGNKMVDAEGIKDCWGPNSIAVREKAAAMLASAARFHKKSYVMRYRF